MLFRSSPPRIRLQETALNLSTGGIRFDLATQPTPLAMVVTDLQDGLPPICAVAELVWQKTRQEDGMLICGHRFVEILKEDQVRLASLVDKIGGGGGGRIKDNWDLQDKMMTDTSAAKSK